MDQPKNPEKNPKIESYLGAPIMDLIIYRSSLSGSHFGSSEVSTGSITYRSSYSGSDLVRELL